jgi:hypothetical protein
MPLTVEIIPGNTAISAPFLPRERELSVTHAQRSSFPIMEQICRPLSVEMVPGKHCEYLNQFYQENETSVWSMRRGAHS